MVKKMHTVVWEPTNGIDVTVEIALLRALVESCQTMEVVSPTWEIIGIPSNYRTSKEIFNGFLIFSFLNICKLTSTNMSHLIRIDKSFALCTKLIFIKW